MERLRELEYQVSFRTDWVCSSRPQTPSGKGDPEPEQPGSGSSSRNLAKAAIAQALDRFGVALDVGKLTDARPSGAPGAHRVIGPRSPVVGAERSANTSATSSRSAASSTLQAAIRAIDEAIEISRAAGHPAQVGNSLCLLGRLQTTQGRLSEATKTYDRLLRLAEEHDDARTSREMGEAHVSIGELLFEWNDLQAATRHVSLGIEHALEWASLGEATGRLLEVTGTHDRLRRLEGVDSDAAHGVVPGYIALARLRQAQDDTEGAIEALRKVELVAQNSRLSPLRAERWGEAWRARLWIAEGNLRAANRWAQDRRLTFSDV